MTREIKFSYIWLHGELGSWGDRHLTLDDIEDESFQDYMHDMLLGHTLVARRQFTGLTDKNGKEVYEGDRWQRDGFIGVVVFKHSAWSLETAHDSQNIQYPSFYSNAGTGEVIGNIYE